MNRTTQYLLAGVTVFSAISACSSTGQRQDSDEGVRFELSQCNLQNQAFTCELTMLSEQQNASIEIKDSTVLEDDQGSEYPLTGGNVANVAIVDGGYTKAQKELKAGSAVAATFVFSNVSVSAKSAKELTVGGRVKMHNKPGWENFKVSLAATP